ncbi:hypothetical protein M2145_002126 [Lachnospiraceae bacterium PF1-21]|uniref:CHAP domain-containing protein n=1 Tax=Ohessyouella blattaphilus TaxID=2949333 RepID=UPI003E184EAC
MQINKERETKIEVEKKLILSELLAVSKASHAFNHSLNSLNETDREYEEQDRGIKNRLNPKELRKWNRLSRRKKETYRKQSRIPQSRELTTVSKSKLPTTGISEKAISNSKKSTAKGISKGISAGAGGVGSEALKRSANKFKEHLAGKEWERKNQENLRVLQIEENNHSENQTARAAGIATAVTTLVTGATSALAVLLVPTIIALVVMATVIAAVLGVTENQGSGAEAIVQVARQEYVLSSRNTGGKKYKEWYGMNADWCAIFLSWCGKECGYIEQQIIPKTASVSNSRIWFKVRNQYHTKESGYKPKAGDFVYFENGMSHIGLVVSYDESKDQIETIEGNSGSSTGIPYHTASQVTNNLYSRKTSSISGFACPDYPENNSVEIPEPYGTVYSYMGWQTITSPSSKQYQLRETAGMRFDKDGFGIIDGRYVIACTTKFGQVGDYIDWTLANGEVIKTVVGDIKNQSDPGCNEYGHKDGACVVEFVVDKDSWYGTSKHPTSFHPEWRSRVVRSDKRGSFEVWKDLQIISQLSSCI